MKSVFKVIILLMIVIVIFAGCSTPQSQSSGSNDSQKSQPDNVPIPDGINYDWVQISVDNVTEDSTTGTHDNFFYTFWKDKEAKGGYPANQGTASMWVWSGATNQHGAWAFGNNIHGLVGGRGWSSGVTNLSITFHGWQAFYADQDGVDDDGYFGVYGWADNNWSSGNPAKLIEYYVVEQHGTKDHGRDNDGDAGTQGATRTIDGSSYTAWKTRRVNKPSIRGNTDFDQYWSVRATQRQSGTMTFSQHVNLWGTRSGWTTLTNNMMNKTLTYQILFVEAPFDANTGSGNGFAYIDSHNR